MKYSFNESLRVYKTVVPFVPSRGQTSFLTAGVRACVCEPHLAAPLPELRLGNETEKKLGSTDFT